MQPIRIHINQLGLVSNADLEITPVMVFSGESGLGKSYLAILSHYFFEVWLNERRVDAFFKSFSTGRCIDFTDSNLEVDDNGTALTMKKNELEQWLAKDAVQYLGYMIGFSGIQGSIEVKLPESVGEDIEFRYERELMGLDNEEDLYWTVSVMHLRYRFRKLGIEDESPYSYLLRHAMIAEIFGNFRSITSTFVFPPSRGAFFSESVSAKTGLFKSFIDGMRSLDEANEMPETSAAESVALFRSLMEGEVQKNGDRYIYVTHGDELPIAAAASSVREMAPLQLILNKRDISKTVMLIEEPEAHLHPLKQRKIADAIVAMAQGGANMQITTHSDYFLRRLNDLIRLHFIARKMSEQEFTSFCKENNLKDQLMLDPSLLSAYFLERRSDGQSVNVLRQELHMGVPFDTFKVINANPMAESAMLYETAMNLSDEMR